MRRGGVHNNNGITFKSVSEEEREKDTQRHASVCEEYPPFHLCMYVTKEDSPIEDRFRTIFINVEISCVLIDAVERVCSVRPGKWTVLFLKLFPEGFR